MSNWKLINKIYIYDGSFEGLLTIVFDSYYKKTLPQKIVSYNNYINNFLDSTITINTDYEKSQNIFNKIANCICKDALYNVYFAFLSDDKEKEINILKYLCNGFDIGPEINNKITLSYVFKVINLRRRVTAERHKLKGLLRFKEIFNNLCYSSIHPDNNILEPLGKHFITRMSSMQFIIHDKNRDLCFIYNGKEYKITSSKNLKLPSLSENEIMYQDLWKLFFNTISIKERKNPRCQMQYMPKKYWNDLIENP